MNCVTSYGTGTPPAVPRVLRAGGLSAELEDGAGLTEVAEALAARLGTDPRIEAAEVAGPGFLNLRLATGQWHEVLRAALARGETRAPWPALVSLALLLSILTFSLSLLGTFLVDRKSVV